MQYILRLISYESNFIFDRCIAYNNYNVIVCNMGYPVTTPSVGYEKAMSRKKINRREWIDSAIRVAFEVADETTGDVDQRNKHVHTFMRGVKWALLNQPIPKEYRNIKDNDFVLW